ncbi:host-nuclease inhibitor Gam family protein [Oscillospiraceae bacterium OttesenSCG-928-F05]|nr:host-nuclease inhibitor Gam family protein [Oscillospiraceae bacterium OttesenSCG-928-F05]
MARTRIIEQSSLKTWADVNEALREIARCELELQDIEASMNKQIAGIKAVAQSEAKPAQARIAALGKDIKAFVEDHPDDLGKKKTKELPFGKTGFRLSSKIVLPRGQEKVKAVIKALRIRGMTDCIKTEESVLKDALKRYSEDKIVEVGAALKKENTFWFETDHEKLIASGEG